MKKFFIIYKYNVLNNLFRKSSYVYYLILFFFLIIMSSVIISLEKKFSGSEIGGVISGFKYIYFFIEGLIFMTLSIVLATYFGKDDIDKCLTKMEQRFGYNVHHLFLIKQISFLTISLLIFTPFILINVIFYLSSDNFLLHYINYQIFISSIAWFFIFCYALMYILHLFLSKTISASLISILMTIFTFLPTIGSMISPYLFVASPETFGQNFASYELNNFRRVVLKDEKLNDELLSIEKDNFDINVVTNFYNALLEMCQNDDANTEIGRYNKILISSIGDYKIFTNNDFDQLPNNINFEFNFDKMLSKISDNDDKIIIQFKQIGRLYSYKQFGTNDDNRFIPCLWMDSYTKDKDNLTYKNIQLAFWSTVLLSHNKTVGDNFATTRSISGNQYQNISNIILKPYSDFYKKQSLNLLLNPIVQFHTMISGNYFNNDENYLIYVSNTLIDNNSNVKFTFDKDNNVIKVGQIINVAVIYIIYLIISIIMVGLAYLKYKSLLNK